jgi:hypothetical protein
LTEEAVELWQRGPRELVRVGVLRRDAILEAKKVDVTWTIVVQPGVTLTMLGPSPQPRVPLLLANPRPNRKSPAVDEFLAAWASRD